MLATRAFRARQNYFTRGPFSDRKRIGHELPTLIDDGSLLLPPVLMEVASSAVALSVTASPPATRSCSTWVWSRPWTGSLRQEGVYYFYYLAHLYQYHLLM